MFCHKKTVSFCNKVFYRFLTKKVQWFAIKLDINSIQPGGIAIVWGKKVAHKGGWNLLAYTN